MHIEKTQKMSLRPLERSDLQFVHGLNNDAKIMRYWFEGNTP
jgi:diamine N-acetyltransferase